MDEAASRILSMVSRAAVSLVNAAAKRITLILGADNPPNVPYYEHYGFTGIPTKDMEALALAIGGDPETLIVICVDGAAYRPKDLGLLDVCVYNAAGQRLELRTLYMHAKSSDVRLGTGVQVAVARNGDTISPTAAMTTWFEAIQAATGVAPPGSMGTVVATAANVKAS